jgi:hypothetical protein
LGFDEPQTGTAQDLAVMTAEVNRILTETLTASLNEAITNEDVTLERIDLTVEPQLSQQRADNVFEGDRRLRALQQQTVNFLISGAARYSVASGSDITSNELEFDTNTAVATTMNDPQIQQALTEEFQNQTVSEPLRNTESVSAEVQAPASVDGNQKPTTVATIFGFILVGIGVIGLGMYGWAFFKKRRKRRRQRKRDRQRGLSGTLNTTHIANTTASMESMNSSINHSRSSPTSKMIVLPPADIENSSSEESDSSASASVYSDPATAPDCAPADSESSASDPYDGIASETSSKSDFTRELELAASLDKRSWIETQRQRGVSCLHRFCYRPFISLAYKFPLMCLLSFQAADGSGAYIRYQSQYEVQGAEMQEGSGEGVITGAAVGIAAAGATAVGVAAVAAKSYPYGDEEESSDSDNVSIDLSEVKNPNVDELLGDAEEGVEWTPEGVWSPYDGYKAQAAEKSVSSLSDSRMADGRSGNQQDRGSWMKSWSSIDSSRGRLGRDKKDTNSNTKSWSSIDSARETQSRSMMLGSLAEDSEVEEELLVQEADRGIEVETVESRAPTISTAGTSNAVRMSPTASATEVIAAEKAKTEEEPDDEDSVLTQDIVKEVSRLARFVKKYDKKREKKLLKDREREEKTALAIKDSQSFPSVGYDAMSDSLSALRKGRVDASTSPRRERTTITNLVEETDESGESERSWSTTSNANRSFDDDDESSPDVDESEIDVSDDSNADEDHSEGASDASRLGITPYSIQRVVGKPQSLKPIKQLRGADSSAPETSRPPVTGKASDSRGLPPLANVADSPHEESPEKTHTPVQTVKRAMLRVSSARQKKFSQRTAQEQAQAPPRVSRSIGLTEDALHELSDGNGPAGVTSPHQKGTLSGLRKNEAILDTASSHFTDGVTSSQYEQAVKAGIFAQQEQQRAYLSRNSFKGTQRVPRDPPAPTSDSASIQATDEKRSPPGYEPKDTSIESRVQPAQSTPQEQTQAEERVPWSRPAPSEAPVDKTERAPSQPDTQRKAMFRPGGFKSTMGGTQNRDSSASQPTSSGLKRAAPEAAPLTPRTQETAPAPVSPAMRSPPRRKKRSSSAFNNVISMFESKPKNPIAPVGEHWQFNGATR